MNKKVISLAILAGMAASTAAVADLTPYVRFHLALESWDDAENGFTNGNFTAATAQAVIDGDLTAGEASALNAVVTRNGSGATEDLDLKSRKSVFGVKGSEDAGGGNKVFYKMEWEVKPDEGSTLTGRDQYIGLKFGQGSVKVGTMTNNYKASGMGLDKLKHTGLEARGFLNMQSAAHSSKGVNGGRSTDTIQYKSPKMGGMQLVVNRTFASTVSNSGGTEETTGVGFRASGKSWSAFVDYLDMVCGAGGIASCASDGTEAAVKFGGKIKFGSASVAIQIEDTADVKVAGTSIEDLDIGEYTYLQGTYDFDKNNTVVLSIGEEGDISSGVALAYMHKTGGASKVYIGYGSRSDELPGGAGDVNEQQLITAGWVASFK